MATAKKKIERAYTAKDIENDDLVCAMINNLNMKINSIDEDDMKEFIKKEFIKLPAGAKHAQSWAKEVELERANICREIEKVVTEAKEDANEALSTPLQNYVTKFAVKPT